MFKIPPHLESQARLAFYAVSLAVPVLLMQGVFWAVLSSFQRFGWMNAIDALTTTAQWSVAGVLACRGDGVGWVVFSAVVARIMSTTACGFLVLQTVPGLQPFRVNRLHGLGKLLRFGGWVSVSQLVGPVLAYLDRALIASFLSLGAVTLYTVPFEVTARLQIIPLSLAGTLYPAFSERGTLTGRDQLQRLYERSVRYLLLLLVPCILYLLVLGSDLFSVWIGPSFAGQTSGVVRILVLGSLANALAYVPYSLLQALGRPDLTGKFHLLELPLYLASSLLLIPRWGIVGAATASAVRFTLDFALLFWAVGRYCECSLRRFWVPPLLRIGMLGCALGLMLLAIKLQFANPWVRLGLGICAVGMCLLCSWYLVVDSRDKPRIGTAVKLLVGQAAS